MCESKKLVRAAADRPNPMIQPNASFTRKESAATFAGPLPWNRSSSEPMKLS